MKVKDPVCDMDVEENSICSIHDGRIYCFCSYICKEIFDLMPEAYVEKEDVDDLEN